MIWLCKSIENRRLLTGVASALPNCPARGGSGRERWPPAAGCGSGTLVVAPHTDLHAAVGSLRVVRPRPSRPRPPLLGASAAPYCALADCLSPSRWRRSSADQHSHGEQAATHPQTHHTQQHTGVPSRRAQLTTLEQRPPAARPAMLRTAGAPPQRAPTDVGVLAMSSARRTLLVQLLLLPLLVTAAEAEPHRPARAVTRWRSTATPSSASSSR